jgi:hypothetical protein
MGAVNWGTKHDAYVVQCDHRQTVWMYCLSGNVHRPGQYKEYLWWLHQSSRLFLNPVYTEEHIAELPDSNDDNDIVDEYNDMTQQGTQPQRAPFQNYVVRSCRLAYLHYLLRWKVKLFVSTFFAQATQLGREKNEAGDALSHPQTRSVAAHSALYAFAEVIMVSNLLLCFSHIVR